MELTESDIERQPSILIVDDEIENLELIQRIFRKDYKVLVASSGAEGLGILSDTPVSVMIADMRMPRMDGAQFLHESIRHQPFSKRILLTAYSDLTSIIQAVNDGQIHQFFTKPFESTALVACVTQLNKMYRLEMENLKLMEGMKSANTQLLSKEKLLTQSLGERERDLIAALQDLKKTNALLEERVLRDGLTGLYNHRSFQERLREELARTSRMGSPLSLILLDVDYFKQVNDEFGHPAGDQVLRRVASVLTGSPLTLGSRQSDVVARYGGEEFALILPDTHKQGALLRAERIRSAVEDASVLEVTDRPELRITASFGVSTFPEDARTAEELIGTADQALAQAKGEGRNRVKGWARHPAQARVLLQNHRDALGNLGAILKRNRSLSLLSFSIPEGARIEIHYGRAAYQKICEEFGRVALKASDELLKGDKVVAAVAPRSDSIDFFLAPSLNELRSPHSLESLCEGLARQIEFGLRSALGVQSVGTLRVIGAYVTQLHARHVSLDHQIRQMSEAGRTQCSVNFQKRRNSDKLELQRLIFNSSIQPFVQPIFRGLAEKPFAYEALSRGPLGTKWESPALLLDLAEDADLTPELDFCMLQSGLKAGKRIPKDSLLFVNILASTLTDNNFIEQELVPLLAHSGLEPARIVLELSERQAAQDLEQLSTAIELARKLNFGVALDDVGSKNANLVEMATLRPDWLKLDRSLVQCVHSNPVKRDLIASIVDFSRRQNSRIVAEGIELQEELEAIRSLNVEWVQGYLLGVPQSLDDLNLGRPLPHTELQVSS